MQVAMVRRVRIRRTYYIVFYIVQLGKVRRVRILRIPNQCHTQELTELGREDYCECSKLQSSLGGDWQG